MSFFGCLGGHASTSLAGEGLFIAAGYVTTQRLSALGTEVWVVLPRLYICFLARGVKDG